MARRGIGRRDLLAAATALGAAGGCAAVRAPEPTAAADGPAAATLYLVSLGWHTEVVFPAGTGLLPPALERDHLGARHLAFGFGERGYFTNPEPTSGDLLRALSPGPAAILARPLHTAPAAVFGEADTVALGVPRAGLARAARFVADDLALDAAGAPIPVAPGPQGGRFYAATRGYALSYTCNTWTIDALASAGLPVSAAGVVLAGQAMDRARRAAAAQRTTVGAA